MLYGVAGAHAVFTNKIPLRQKPVLRGAGENDWIVWSFADDGQEQGEADAEFIAAARTDVPALVAEVERLRRDRPSLSILVTAATFWLNRGVGAR